MNGRGAPTAIIIAAVGLGGCLYTTPAPHLPDGFPPYAQVDEEASQVTYFDEEGGSVSQNEAWKVRSDIANLLTSAERTSPSEGSNTHPIRFRAEVATTRSVGLYIACFLAPCASLIGCFGFEVLPIIAGCAGESGTSYVKITIDTGTELLSGEGRASAGGSVLVSALRRATAFALETAVADALGHRMPSNVTH